MHSLSASELLSLWERGLPLGAQERALALLCATGGTEAGPEALARLSIGARDRRLLRLRECTFGPQLMSVAMCPRCSERLEFSFDVEEITAGPETLEQGRFSLSVNGYEVEFRLPNSLDLLALTSGTDIHLAERFLLARCLLSARRDDAEKTIDELPAEVIEALANEMGRSDPQADVQLALSCPQCRHEWKLAFDIASFFWNELNAWAQRVLREVHALASAYGWREEEILSMSAWRRQIYLGMIGV
jgi:hypothetical protein